MKKDDIEVILLFFWQVFCVIIIIVKFVRVY